MAIPRTTRFLEMTGAVASGRLLALFWRRSAVTVRERRGDLVFRRSKVVG